MGHPDLHKKNGGILRISDASLEGFRTTRLSPRPLGSGQARGGVERGVVSSAGGRGAARAVAHGRHGRRLALRPVQTVKIIRRAPRPRR